MAGGFCAFIGINNSGKSSVLRFFYEFRNIFERLAEAFTSTAFRDLLKNANQKESFNIPTNIFDYEEMFCDANTSDIEITIQWRTQSLTSGLAPGRPRRMKLVITVHRETNHWSPHLEVDEVRFLAASFGDIRATNEIIEWGDRITTPRGEPTAIFNALVNTI